MRQLLPARLCYALLLLVLCGCDGPPTDREPGRRGEDFVADPDHLYFKNLRARAYRAESRETGVDWYYHDDLTTSTARLQATIEDRWIDDAARLHLWLRPAADAALRPPPFEVEFTRRRGELEIIEVLGPLPRAAVVALRTALEGNREITVNLDGQPYVAFPEPAARAEALTVFRDYLRLVGG